MDKRVVIFDFDGTLADTGPIIRKLYADIAKKNGLRPMSAQDYAELRKGTLKDARKWTGIKIWQFPLVVHSIKRLMYVQSEEVRLFPQMITIVKQLHEQNIKMYILSSNTSDTIQKVLTRHDLEGYFEILPLRRRLLGGKAGAIKKLLKRNQFSRRSVWMVGDEVRDIRAAKLAKVKSVAVTWGLQDKVILKRNRPTHLATSFAELKTILGL